MVSRSVTRTISTVLVICLLLCGAAVGFYFGLSYVLSQNERYAKLDEEFKAAKDAGTALIDETTPGAVELIIPRGSETKDIAELLEKKGIIDNTFLFTLLSKFNGFDNAYVSGTHYVTKAMSYDEIMYMLSQNPETVTITFPEGLTYKEVKAKLKAAGVNFDEKTMDDMVHNPQMFLDYDFVTDIKISDERDWLLQGYLWPDTYQFDVNTDEETILRTFLNNTENKLADEYYARAEKMGITIDQAITLASIIQNECTKTEEMRTVSGVFWNRLKRGNKSDVWFPLESCATVNYLRKEAGYDPVLWATKNDITFDSLYNTYNYEGLPPGPICSPGEDAIRAALWPESNAFLYFCADGAGNNIFAKTLSEQERNIAKYSK